MDKVSLIYIIIWYLYLLSVGLIFFPLTTILFKKFWDKGYAFSKIIGIILISFTFFLLGSIITPTRTVLISIIITFFLLSFSLTKKHKIKIKPYKLIITETLFLTAFLLWAYVRGQNPDIHGLEKFMDFGFINSILKSSKFPPLDIWLASTKTSKNFINYYYFGHLQAATLIKLSNIPSYFGYNLTLATIFGLGIAESFSITITLAKNMIKKVNKVKAVIIGIVGAYLTNLAGNLHTIYLFSKGYKGDFPPPFWKIFSLKPHPELYWYPNATRFIYHTIHEFPSYSYVVADLHGHVFDIPAILLTIALVYSLFFLKEKIKNKEIVIFGFLTAVHYMTNAFDAPIYLLFIITAILITNHNKNIKGSLKKIIILITSFIIFSLPFSSHFQPFSHQIGLNCPTRFLANLGHLGPFVFIYQNCQLSPFWMLFILWGFFWINFILFITKKEKNILKKKYLFLTLLFSFNVFLIIIPEFFYAKDIYPTYFRANTMFKLGYQAFIMGSIASAVAVFIQTKNKYLNLSSKLIIAPALALVSIYPFLAVPSYYGNLHKKASLDGERWVYNSYPSIKEAIDWINKNIKDQPTILEAQGDSYTDYNLISSYTGLPTVGGWYVHEWLWRGNPKIEGERVPDIKNIYTSNNLNKTKELIDKYQIKYIIISPLERKKYLTINEEKFKKLGKAVFTSTNGQTTIYKLDY